MSIGTEWYRRPDQGVNERGSGCRVTDTETGRVASCHRHRSRWQNRDEALRRLKTYPARPTGQVPDATQFFSPETTSYFEMQPSSGEFGYKFVQHGEHIGTFTLEELMGFAKARPVLSKPDDQLVEEKLGHISGTHREVSAKFLTLQGAWDTNFHVSDKGYELVIEWGLEQEEDARSYARFSYYRPENWRPEQSWEAFCFKKPGVRMKYELDGELRRLNDFAEFLRRFRS